MGGEGSDDNNSGLTELELGNDDVIGFLKQKFKWICIMHSCSFKASFSFSKADNRKKFKIQMNFIFFSNKVLAMKYHIYHSVLEDVTSVFKSLETGIRSGTIMAKVLYKSKFIYKHIGFLFRI